MPRLVRRDVPSGVELPSTLHPVLRRVYAARGVRSEAELDYSLARLPSFESLRGIDEAVDLLAEALASGHRILVVADYDVDGATSCALAIRALSQMGAVDVRYLVPNRFEVGHGLSPELVEQAATLGPSLIMTVDNGISSLAGVEAARQRGIKVLVTDHHLPGNELPHAEAIVNPNLPEDEFPSKHLAGVGVTLYVLLALRARLRAVGWFGQRGIPEPNLAQWLDLVALGTVADVVPLDHTNRILVTQGLRRIRSGDALPGIRALLAIAGRRGRIGSADLGFAVGPRLNAAGRLTDMSVGVECLLTEDEERAARLAEQLDELNRERRAIERQMESEALRELEDLAIGDLDELPYGLCLFRESWHQGVIGILASRIKDRTHRPVITFAGDGPDRLKGSARSVAKVHVRDVLETISGRAPELLSKFGGHARAAGLTLPRSGFDEFSARFDEEVRRHLSAEDLEGTIRTDGQLEPVDLDIPLARALERGGPWGQEFPEPVFEGVFEVFSHRVLNDRHLKLVLRVDSGRLLNAIAFRTLPPDGFANSCRARLAYRLEVNEYQGNVTPQLVVQHLDLA